MTVTPPRAACVSHASLIGQEYVPGKFLTFLCGRHGCPSDFSCLFRRLMIWTCALSCDFSCLFRRLMIWTCALSLIPL